MKTHKHKCNACGHVWEHDQTSAGSTKAHTCKCGTEVWHRFHGEGERHLCERLEIDLMVMDFLMMAVALKLAMKFNDAELQG